MKKAMVIITLLGLYFCSVPVNVYSDEQKQTNRIKDADKTPRRDKKQIAKPDGSPEWKTRILEEHEEFLTWLSEHYPDKYEGLMTTLEKQPEKFANRINYFLRVYDPIRQAQKNNPPLAEVLQKDLALQQRRDELLKEIRDAEEKDREPLIAQLKEVVAERFDIIIRRKELQLEGLQKRLEKLKKNLEKRAVELESLKTEKNNNVDQRMKELLENKGVDWK